MDAAKRRTGGACLQRNSDRFEHAVELTINFKIAEPENPISKLTQDPVTHFIPPTMPVISVLIAIDLDDET